MEYPLSHLASIFHEVRELFILVVGGSRYVIFRSTNGVIHSPATSISLYMGDRVCVTMFY